MEAELDNGTFIPPNTTTVESFLNEFVELYGEKRWGLSIYASNTALINNYINPLIGNLVVQDINKRTVDKYIQQRMLLSVFGFFRTSLVDDLPPISLGNTKRISFSPSASIALWSTQFIEQYGDQIMTQLAKKMLGA